MLGYVAGVIVVLAGVMALVFPGPEQGINVGTLGAGVPILWGVAFVGLAEYTERVDDIES